MARLKPCPDAKQDLRRKQEFREHEMKEKELRSNAVEEPWLRGTLTDVAAVPRGVLHALELATEDVEKWCGRLSDEELNARPAGLAPVAFHLRHIARSLDRLLTYAEGRELDEGQLAALKAELDGEARRDAVFEEFALAIEKSAARVRALAAMNFEASRFVGKKRFPTTLGGLLVHVADHTQRHVGQAIVTVKIVVAQRP
jgi:uncharacterized damage-inducible protein DinB